MQRAMQQRLGQLQQQEKQLNYTSQLALLNKSNLIVCNKKLTTFGSFLVTLLYYLH